MRGSLGEVTLRDAYELSVLSLVASMIAILMGGLSSSLTGSPTALGYCLENSVDFVGSVFVLWRFRVFRVSKEILDSRELRADAGISAMFVVLGAVVAADGVKGIVAKHPDRDVSLLIAFYAPSLAVFLFLGFAKIHVGRAVKSISLQKDGMCSLAGALLSAGVLMSALVEEFSPIWWLDSFVAILVACALAAKGVSSLVGFARKGIKFWTLNFWRGVAAKPPPPDARCCDDPLEGDPLLAPL